MHVFVALREKQLPFTMVDYDLPAGAVRTAAFREKSLTGRVPALQHGDYWLTESSAVSEYLAETFPFPNHPRIWPADFKERSRARQLMHWFRSDLLPLRDERPTSSVFGAPTGKTLSAAGCAAADQLVDALGRVIGEGRTTLFDAWCIADVDVGLMLQRLLKNGDPLPERLVAYANAQWARPSVAEWVAEAERRTRR
jgi:glutathione S-transferase